MILILYLFLSIRSSSFHFNHRLSEEENPPPLQPTLRYYGWFEHTPCFVRLLIAILILVAAAYFFQFQTSSCMAFKNGCGDQDSYIDKNVRTILTYNHC